jgi:hypothetical protein
MMIGILERATNAMSTASIQISGLRRQTIASLTSQARAQGLSVEGYVKEIIEAEMSISDMARRKTIDEVFAPAQQQFRESGMSEDELDQLVDAARHDQPNKVARLGREWQSCRSQRGGGLGQLTLLSPEPPKTRR